MKVLVVDDHALVCDGLAALLPALDPDLDIVAAGSCEAALALSEAEHAAVRLVLLDLGLPGASGIEAVVAMRAAFLDVPIVVLTGNEDRDAVLGAIRAGAAGFVPKSYSGDRLLGALRFVLRHKGVFVPAELLIDAGQADAPCAAGPAQDRQPADRTEPSDDTQRAGATDRAEDTDGRVVRASMRQLGLSPRQAAVLALVMQGRSNKAIARELAIEDATVRSHVTVVLRALNAATRTQAVVAAHRLGLDRAAGRASAAAASSAAGWPAA